MAVNCRSGVFGALFMAMRALVLAGLPTTRTFTSAGRRVGDRLALGGEDGAVGRQQVGPLHALLAGHGADQQAVVGVAERRVGVVGAAPRRRAAGRRSRRAPCARPRARRRPAGSRAAAGSRAGRRPASARWRCGTAGVADLAGGTGDGDAYGILHGELLEIGDGRAAPPATRHRGGRRPTIVVALTCAKGRRRRNRVPGHGVTSMCDGPAVRPSGVRSYLLAGAAVIGGLTALCLVVGLALGVLVAVALAGFDGLQIDRGSQADRGDGRLGGHGGDRAGLVRPAGRAVGAAARRRRARALAGRQPRGGRQRPPAGDLGGHPTRGVRRGRAARRSARPSRHLPGPDLGRGLGFPHGRRLRIRRALQRGSAAR